MSCVALILNYNDSDNTLKLVNKLIYMDSIDSIIIVDNNSNNENKAKLNNYIDGFSKVKILFSEKNLYYAGGTNYGLDYIFSNINTDYILIVNSDVLFEHESLLKCIEYMKKNNNIALCAPQMLDYNHNIDYTVSWKEKSYIHFIHSCFYIGRRILEKKYYASNCEVYAIRGSFQLFNYDILKAIDGYDTNVLLYYEEDIMGAKIKKLGFSCDVLTNCSYVHNHPPGKRVNTKQFKIAMSDMYYYYLNYCKNSFLGRIFLKICIFLGVFEHYFIDLYFKLFKRN